MLIDINIYMSSNPEGFHKLQERWTLYTHLPHDTDWSIDSYREILTFTNVEEAISLYESIPETLVKNCMLFLMKNDIKPVWEDVSNKKGGCFSYKINNNNVYNAWKNLSYSLMGRTASMNQDIQEHINGASISPKRNFCIIKIWMNDNTYTNPKNIIPIPSLECNSVLFKLHSPEY